LGAQYFTKALRGSKRKLPCFSIIIVKIVTPSTTMSLDRKSCTLFKLVAF